MKEMHLVLGSEGSIKSPNFVQLPLETALAAGMEDKVPGSCICFSLKLQPMFHRQCRLCGGGVANKSHVSREIFKGEQKRTEVFSMRGLKLNFQTMGIMWSKSSSATKCKCANPCTCVRREFSQSNPYSEHMLVEKTQVFAFCSNLSRIRMISIPGNCTMIQL